MASYFPYAQAQVIDANGVDLPLGPSYTFATFINQGGANGEIDFGAGNSAILKPGQSLSMPYLGRAYGPCTVKGTGTRIQAIYVE